MTAAAEAAAAGVSVFLLQLTEASSLPPVCFGSDKLWRHKENTEAFTAVTVRFYTLVLLQSSHVVNV